MRVLHIFPHGLGDATQFGVVLRHLKRVHPDWDNFVLTLKGRHTALAQLANDCVHDTLPPNAVRPEGVYDGVKKDFDQVFEHKWPECHVSYRHSPSTKAIRCLKEVFGIEPIPELCTYTMIIDPERREAADYYVGTLPHHKFAVIHYRAFSNNDKKGLSDEEAKEICTFLQDRGVIPVVLDWDASCPFVDQKRVFCPGKHDPLWRGWGTGCASTIAALMERASVTVCIDSGPGKIALSVPNTPAVQFWNLMHPVHYADPAPHAVHMLNHNHLQLVRPPLADGRAYFVENYRWACYRNDRLARTVAEVAWKMAEGISLEVKEGSDGTEIHTPQKLVPPVKTNGDCLRERVQSGFVIGIPTLNQYARLHECLLSICRSTALPKSIFIIDNGRDLDPLTQLNGMISYRDNCEIIRPQQNLGVGASWNMLIRLANPLPVILLNDDVILADDSLKKMLAVNAPLVLGSGFSAFLFEPELLKSVGEFDEKFYPAYHEDDDYLWRMKLADIALGMIECGIEHTPSSTIESFGEVERREFDLEWKKCHERYQQKWGGLPGRESFQLPFGK